jgi:hypothetical protein
VGHAHIAYKTQEPLRLYIWVMLFFQLVLHDSALHTWQTTAGSTHQSGLWSGWHTVHSQHSGLGPILFDILGTQHELGLGGFILSRALLNHITMGYD